MTAPERILRTDDILCACCRRRAAGIGHTQKGYGNMPVLWVCDDPECLQLAKETYAMRQHDFDRIESLAALDAAYAAGDWLVKQGLASQPLEQMTPDQWDAAIKIAVGTYRSALKTRVVTGESPF